MTRIILSLIILSYALVSKSQVGVGQWQDHLSYKEAVSVAEGNGKVYCATTGGIFFLNKNDNSMERMTKVNGLSDIDPAVLNFNKYNNKLLIAYKNSNLDLIDKDVIINISDIKRKSIIGNKSINNIYFINQYAYLSCGFGIVVVDMNRIEVKDTYYIGPNGTSLNIRDITSDATYLYAATDVGIYRASLSNPNLANFASWALMSGLPSGVYNAIAHINGKIVTNFSKLLTSNQAYKDTLYMYNGVTWSYFSTGSGTFTVHSLKTCANLLVIARDVDVTPFDSNLNGVGYYPGYAPDVVRINSAVIDEQGGVWMADSKYGLVSWRPVVGTQSQYPDGPSSSNIFGMSLQNGSLLVAPGGKSGSFADGLYYYKGRDWKNIKGKYPSVVNLNDINNIVNVLIDHNDPRRFYAAAWGKGLIEFYDEVPVKHYTSANSSLQKIPDGPDSIRVEGLTMDAENNLWVSNALVQSCISVKSPDGAWHALDFSSIVGNSSFPDRILVDGNNQKWIILSGAVGGGLLVYKGGSTGTPNSSNTKKLSPEEGNGALPSNGVYSIAEDLDGQIWIGTDKGVAIFYNPEKVFSNENFDSEQILIEQDGHVQILLETEQIQALAIDGANRKWIGTANSGVFLMSEDGREQIHHFDMSNSPLFSNNVSRIEIDHLTGEVYFGTSKGIISYGGTATGTDENGFGDVYAYPNPVKHEYNGPIAIKGLMYKSTVKITDISGTLVYETTSEGGTAVWYGKNFKGEKVSTGVYMVFCTSEDGTEKIATKILLIN